MKGEIKLAVGDKLVNTDHARAMYQNLDGKIGDLKSASDVIKASLMDGTIPYAVNGTITGTTANGGISAEQTNNVITLNGTSTASSSQGWSKISLCEPFVAWRSATSPEEWTASKPITFFVNHIYQFLLTKKSGTFGGSIRFVGYDSSGQLIFDPVELLTTDTSKTYVYAPESDVNANLLIFAKTATTFTDAALEIKVNDITFDTEKQDKLTFDTVPMANSTNPATSGGTYTDGTVAIQTSGTAVDEIIGASPLTFRNGVYKGTSDGTAMAGVPMYTSPGDQFICAECECKAGDTITINGNGSSGLYRMWYIVNTNGVIVDNANANISGMQKVTVSNGGVKIYVNLLKTSTNPYAYKGDKLNSSVPDYYANHLDEKIASINALNDTMDDSFIFLTDYHWQGNAQNSPALIKEIVKRTGISKLFFGGDAGRTSSSKYQAAEEDASIYGKLRNSVPHFYGMTGNHEWNEQQQVENEATPSSNAYSRKGVVNYYLDHDRQIASNMSPEGNYYVDSGKIRYFVIQCTGHARVTNATCEWLIGQLNAVPDGQFVVLISHAAYDGYAHSSNVEQYYGDRCRMSVLRLTQIMAAYKAKQASTDSGAIQINELADNFDASGSSPYITGTISYDFHSAHGTPICVFAGHVHYDYQNKPNGIYNVFTTTDAYEMEDANKSSLTRTAGTITEQAFDVVHIDLTNRQFRLTRIGAGEDRATFSF